MVNAVRQFFGCWLILAGYCTAALAAALGLAGMVIVAGAAAVSVAAMWAVMRGREMA